MKTLYQIFILALLTLSSCSSSLYTGAEYDDLYYLPSDRPISSGRSSVNDQIAEGNLKGNDYYNNIYAADTLVSEQYSDAVDYDTQVNNNNFNNNEGYEYFNDNSYTGRLRMFYGNYFNPYWREPSYFDYGYGGYPYSYGLGNSFYGFSPYYGYGGGFYNDYYGGYYPGYYGGGYGGGYYGGGFYGGYYGGYNSFYSPFYGYSGNYLHNGGENSVPYGRNERASSMSSRWNSSVGGIGSSRRDQNLSGSNSRVNGRSSVTQSPASDQRRSTSSGLNSQQSVNQTTRRSGQDQTKPLYIRSNSTSPRTNANTRPDYNSANRSYTPSYNNPRMSTRPSYNNSRVSEGVNSDVNRNSSSPNNSSVYNNNNAGSVRTPSNQGSYQNSNNNVRSNSSGNGVQRRSESSSGYSAPANQSRSNSSRSSESYSVPSRSSVERSGTSSGSSSGNSSRSSSSYSGGSESRGSYSSGSSSSGSSSSGSSSSSSSGGSGSSSGRR